VFAGDTADDDASVLLSGVSEKRKRCVGRRIWQKVRARMARRRRASLRTWDWRERRVRRRVGEKDFVRSLNMLVVL